MRAETCAEENFRVNVKHENIFEKRKILQEGWPAKLFKTIEICEKTLRKLPVWERKCGKVNVLKNEFQ